MMGDVRGWLWFLIPLGAGVLSLREYQIAKLCFTVSGLLLTWKVLMELHSDLSRMPIGLRLLVAFSVCGAIGVGTLLSWIWIDKKHVEDKPAIASHTSTAIGPTSMAVQARTSKIPEPPPFKGADQMSVLIPFVPTWVNSPIPLNENLQDSHSDFYRNITSLAGRPDSSPEGWPQYKPRNFQNADEPFRFAAKLMQLYVFQEIDELRRGSRGTGWVSGGGVIAIDKQPISCPQAEPYRLNQFNKTILENEFFPASRSFIWKDNPPQFPLDTTVEFTEQNENGKPFLTFVTLERKNYF